MRRSGVIATEHKHWPVVLAVETLARNLKARSGERTVAAWVGIETAPPEAFCTNTRLEIPENSMQMYNRLIRKIRIKKKMHANTADTHTQTRGVKDVL